MIVSDLFKIRDINYHEFQWSVTWEGYGTVGKTDSKALDKMWDAAWDTGAWTVAFTGGTKDQIAIYKRSTLDNHHLSPRFYLDHVIPLTGVAFETRAQAEEFVHTMEQQIILSVLKRDYVDE
jgi:hypothetical protein